MTDNTTLARKARAAADRIVSDSRDVTTADRINASLVLKECATALSQQGAAVGELPPYIYGREAGANEKVWTETAVRAALAQQAGKVEPYAHIVELPAGEYAGTVKFFTAPSDPRGRPVYLHQAATPSREVEPLTAEALGIAMTNSYYDAASFIAGVRFAERAHGIHSREGGSNGE